MSLSIGLKGIKSSLDTFSNALYANRGEWMGRAVSLIKHGVKNLLSSLQDRRIAAISLVIATIISIEICEVVVHYAEKYHPFKKDYAKIFGFNMGLISFAGGVYAFAKITKLPLASYTIIGISATTLVIYGSSKD